MRTISVSLVLILLAVLAAGCSRTPKGVLGKERMAALLADIHEAEGVIETDRSIYGSDSMKAVLRESVYRRHGVTAAEVDSSMNWYGYHIEDYMEVYDRVLELLDKRMAVAGSMGNTQASATPDGTGYSVTVEGDSVDVWTAQRRRIFYSIGGGNYFTYRLMRDRTWEPEDCYTLRFKLLNPQRAVTASLIVEYPGEKLEIVSRDFTTAGFHEVTLRTDSERKAQSVSVALEYHPEGTEWMYVDSISLVRSRQHYSRPQSPAVSEMPDSAAQPVSAL